MMSFLGYFWNWFYKPRPPVDRNQLTKKFCDFVERYVAKKMREGMNGIRPVTLKSYNELLADFICDTAESPFVGDYDFPYSEALKFLFEQGFFVQWLGNCKVKIQGK